jgi:hypothetical protein
MTNAPFGAAASNATAGMPRAVAAERPGRSRFRTMSMNPSIPPEGGDDERT